MSLRGKIFTSAIAISAALVCTPAAAQTQQRRGYQLEAQDLGSALRSVGRTSNSEIYFETDIVDGKRAPALKGQYTPREAVEVLIQGTNLVILERRGAIIIRERFPPSRAAVNESSGQSTIIVTGSRIRGAPATSPITSVSRRDAELAGQTDLGQMIRDLPQNFSGGQNPTIAGPGQGGTQNTTGSSALNLRGLGPDASLTLINGHRVAFDAIYQGVDISAIPIAAIQRIDVMADGASALYGSDAVGGVANVILRRDVDGIITSARFGAATDGGAKAQQYSIVGGPSWEGGSAMVALDYRRVTEIVGRHRSYTSSLSPDATMIAGLEQVGLALAGQQKLTDNLTFEFDGNYLRRTVPQCLTVSVTAPDSCYDDGSVVSSRVESWSISPSLRLALASNWTVRISGTYSKSDTSITNHIVTGGVETLLVRPKYYNDLKSIEIGAEGPLVSLPGGNARLALGGGYRSTSLDFDLRGFVGGVELPFGTFNEARGVAFGYGELFLPLISRENEINFVEKLQVVSALRYEDHRGIGRVTTPKIGMIYSPVKGLDFRASWGRSFKAPTLHQLGQASNAQLTPSGNYLPSPPTSQPVLYVFGGNENLRPERATTWNFSTIINPVALDGLQAEASYFRIRYRNRVAEPVLSPSTAFLPIYSRFVQLNPTETDVLDAINGLNGVFMNLTSDPFDPSAVAAIFRNNLQNVALQTVEGMDLSISYTRELDQDGQISLKGSASYIDSERIVTEGMVPTKQAGIIFAPPHWRGRLLSTWERGAITLTAIASYVGGTKDNRAAPTAKIASFTSFDAVLKVRSTDKRGLLANVEWTIGVENLFNKKPALIRTSLPSIPPYDSLNQSPVGRVVNLTITKAW